jgi:hypothetical protein
MPSARSLAAAARADGTVRQDKARQAVRSVHHSTNQICRVTRPPAKLSRTTCIANPTYNASSLAAPLRGLNLAMT